MKNYKILNDVDRGKWQDFVLNHPLGNIFQTPEMYDVFKATKNYFPELVVIMDLEDNIVGILLAVIQKEYRAILGVFTARSIVWGGPLAKDNNQEIIDVILKEYNRIIKKKVIYSQFRNLWKQEEEKNIFEKLHFKYEEHLNILVDLTQSTDTLHQKMHKERRHNIRRAINKGTTFKELSSKKDIKYIYLLIAETYKRISLPFVDKSLIESSFKFLYKKGRVKYFSAINNGVIIGARIVLCYKELVYDWYAGSSNTYKNKYPNDLLPWKIILWAKENNYKIFDFGGAGKANKPYGVRDYKLKFGGELVNFGRYNKVHKPILMNIGKIMFYIYRQIKK